MLQKIEIQEGSQWLDDLKHSISFLGYAVIEKVFDTVELDTLKTAMYKVQKDIEAEIGVERLDRAGELGVLRNMIKYNPIFIKLLEKSIILEIIDHLLTNTAILHLQNGFILPSFEPDTKKEVFQNTFHRDFPRVLDPYLLSLNVFIAVDEFTADNGSTLLIPGSHQHKENPTPRYMQKNSVPAICPAGSILVFDSTLWHAAGINTSGKDRLAINHQFTRSYVKQQIDYVRALGNDFIETMNPRTQQILGYYTRVVTSLDEYYQRPEKRLYRSGQG